MTAVYRLPVVSTALLFGALLAALCLAGPANAQEGPVHGTVQSISGQTVTIEVDSGYRVEAGTQGTIWATKMTLGEETSVEQGQIRVQGTDGRSVTAQLTEGKGIEEGQDVRFGTVREVGTLTVRVQPEDATVYVLRQEEEARRLGKGTVRQVVDTGPRQLGATADGYNTEEKSVLVERGEDQVVTFNLSRALGRLTVETTPSSAQLEIETDAFQYEQIGRTPVQNYELEPGAYDLKISKDGYETITPEVGVEAGDVTKKSYTLEEKVATLIVTSEPDGASVYVDGDYKGETRLETEIAPGRYNVEVRESDYENEEENVILSAGERQSLSFDLNEVVTADNTSSSDPEASSGDTNWLWSAALLAGVIYLTTSSSDDESDNSSSSNASTSKMKSVGKGISLNLSF
jgi:hypothetical protein